MHRQLQALKPQGFDIYVNLCEGYLEWDVPSVDVIHSLEQLDLPYTGPTPQLYDPSKPLMKYVAHSAGVATPRHVVVGPDDDAVAAAARAKLRYPLFVKPAKAGDSLGVDEHACVADAEALRGQVAQVQRDYPELLVEEFIEGREFTVLVIGDADGHGRSTALAPIEYRFPEGRRYKSYALKTSELHPDANVRVTDPTLVQRLQDAARIVFRSFDATGYARMDFRMDAAGTLYFLEIDFTCSVFYPEGWEGSADHILRLDGLGQAGFLERIVAEGRARYARRRKAYTMRGDAIAGYGIVAARALQAGEAIFRGEERPFRLVTRRHVETHWGATEQELFRRYAYPISAEVYAIWGQRALGVGAAEPFLRPEHRLPRPRRRGRACDCRWRRADARLRAVPGHRRRALRLCLRSPALPWRGHGDGGKLGDRARSGSTVTAVGVSVGSAT